MTWRVIQADVMDGLASLPDASVQTVITSPPYWGLRDYGTAEWEGGDAACDHKKPRSPVDVTSTLESVHANTNHAQEPAYREWCGKCGAVRRDQQLGLEPTPEAYVERMVAVFREVRRVLRSDGTVWLNLGDTYAGSDIGTSNWTSGDSSYHGDRAKLAHGLPAKNLVGIPWRVAFALQADGWYLRSDIIWSKPNPMPESVTDRPTKAHEYVFLLTRSARYFYDADAVREAAVKSGTPGHLSSGNGTRHENHTALAGEAWEQDAGRNLRSVWSIATEPYPEAHFATFPKALVVPCVKAGTSEKGCCPECGAAWVRVVEREVLANGRGRDHIAGEAAEWKDGWEGVPRASLRTETTGWKPSCECGSMTFPSGDNATHPPRTPEPVPCTVLDPFAGSGTVGVVALRHGRSFVGIELNPTYAEMARERIRNDGPLFNIAAEVTA